MNTTTRTSNGRRASGATLRLASWRVPMMFLAAALLAACGTATTARADRVGHNISAGYVQVDQIPGWPRDAMDVDDNTNALLTLQMAVNDFRLQNSATDSGWNRADFRVRIGDSELDDAANGVLISAVAQNQRNNYGTNAMETCGSVPYGDGHYEVVTFNSPFSSSTTANRGEANVNFSAAYFPYSSFWGGVARNSANGAVFDNFVGSPGLVMGTHFIDAKATNGPNGTAYLDLRAFGINSQNDGVLLVNHAKNEANYALSKAQVDGTWTIWSHDNRANGASYEQDPLAFVFIPKANTNVVSGKFLADGTITMYSGPSQQFTVANTAVGKWLLKVTGGSATNGVLIISPEGGETINNDNIVTYQPTAAGDGWEIQSRDLPGCALETPTAQPVCSFVYIPVETPGVTSRPAGGLVTYEDGRSAEFTITLTGSPKPTSDVTVTLNSSDTTEGTVSLTTLTLTPADWNVPQTVTVTGVDDALPDGAQAYAINFAPLSSTDPQYNGFVPASVSALNNDNETGISFDKTSITTTEAGGTATYTAVLNALPTADVTLNLSSSKPSEATVSPSSLLFTPADWNVPQTITVTGQNDFVIDGNVAYTILGSMVSADPLNNGISANMPGVNTDNDFAGVVLTGGTMTISESNTTATYTLVLTSKPADFVNINCDSGDTTEGTVSPASVTFTPDNWNVARTITVTAVDDFIPDGPVSFLITNTIDTEVPAYIPVQVGNVSVTTLDNEPILTMPYAPVYGIGQAPVALDPWTTITEPDTANYSGGSIAVTNASGTANDRFTVRNIGTGPGQVSVSGTTVSYENVAVGTVSGGTGTTPLVVSFNAAAATPAAAQAVLQAIAYSNVDANAPAGTRTLTVALADGKGGTALPVVKTLTLIGPTVSEFQYGVDTGFGPYYGANDVEFHPDYQTQPFPTGYSAVAGMWLDWINSALSQEQVLLRFTNIVGTAPGQIPAGARIVNAELVLYINDSGHGFRLNRMLGDWDAETSTPFDFGGGVDLDDVEAESGTNAFLGDVAGGTTTGIGFRGVGVTRDVQAWVNGTANFGWVFSLWPRSSDGNGTGFYPCDPSFTTDPSRRPRLHVEWLPPSVSETSFRQGVDGYTGAADTQLREIDPTLEYSANIVLTTDWQAVNPPETNLQQVLIRFSDIIGNGASQVPPYAVIKSAVLELTSVTSDSQGDGGQVCRMLQNWNATDTWDVWVSGITNDGVEAALSPTVGIGPSDVAQTPVLSTMNSVALTADVQAWANGGANYGWVILPWPGGNDGWGFISSDHDYLNWRPQLRVYWTPGEAPEVIRIGKPVHNGTSVQLTFTGKANQAYTILRSSTVNGSYTSAGNATANGSGVATWTDNAPPTAGAFYRVTR